MAFSLSIKKYLGFSSDQEMNTSSSSASNACVTLCFIFIYIHFNCFFYFSQTVYTYAQGNHMYERASVTFNWTLIPIMHCSNKTNVKFWQMTFEKASEELSE